MHNETEYTEALTQRDREIEHLHKFQEMSKLFSTSQDPRVLLNILLDQATVQLQIDAATVLLFNQQTQTLEYAVGKGFRSMALVHSRLRLGEGYAGLAAKEQRIIYVPNLIEAMGDFTRAPLLGSEDFILYYGVPLVAQGQIKGVLELFHRASLSHDQYWRDLTLAIAAEAAQALDHAGRYNELQDAHIELTLAYDATLERIAQAFDLRDQESAGHTQRVTDMAVRLARAVGVNEEEIVHIRRGALLHDIGKLGISDAILLKPGPLTPEEMDIIRSYPMYAYELLAPIGYLRNALDIPYCHHEKWDGTGYPRGLKGEQIPLAARIFAVIEVWDALRSRRPYKPPWPEERVRAHIQSAAGSHFDPRVVELFLQMDQQV